MKKVYVAKAGSGGQEVRDFKVGPGTTAEQILKEMGFQEGKGMLSAAGNEGRPLTGADDVYSAVADQSKLFASHVPAVGR